MREGEDQERARNQPSGLGPADLEAGRNAAGSGLADLLARVEAVGAAQQINHGDANATLAVQHLGPGRSSGTRAMAAQSAAGQAIAGLRSLDAQIEVATGLAVKTDGAGRAIRASGRVYRVPHYTACLDAALGLVERVLPGWIVRADIRPGDNEISVEPPWSDDGLPAPPSFYVGCAKTPALALLAALLKALIALPDPPVGA